VSKCVRDEPESVCLRDVLDGDDGLMSGKGRQAGRLVL